MIPSTALACYFGIWLNQYTFDIQSPLLLGTVYVILSTTMYFTAILLLQVHEAKTVIDMVIGKVLRKLGRKK